MKGKKIMIISSKLNLTSTPFNLNEEEIVNVYNIVADMSLDEKVKHLFAPITFSTDPEFLKKWVQKYQPSTVTFRPSGKADLQNAYRILQENSKIPLLLAGNLEDGGNGLALEGTYYGKPMQVAATDDTSYSEALGEIAGAEAAALGANWSFGPIVDIDLNWRNPITNLRTFGSDVERVKRMSLAYKKGFEKSGGILAAKHFPGDGTDERDQHLHVTFNHLTVDEWWETYGSVYQELIEDGIQSIMVGHIAFPAYSKKKGVHAKQIKPATLAPELLQDLLRDELAFNGLIVTDATPMVGFASAEARETALPKAIAAGCDMILFNRNYDEDILFMHQGIKDGLVSEERITEAVIRIIATKMTMGLFNKENIVPGPKALEEIGTVENKNKARDLAKESVTLVRDRDTLLPLTKGKRIFVVPIDLPKDSEIVNQFISGLRSQGAMIEHQTPEKFDFSWADKSLKELREKYDYAIYLSAKQSRSNQTQVRLNWLPFLALNTPWFLHEVPSLFISFGNPYHLIDVPYISTYINAYADNQETIEETVEKLMGNDTFRGKSPIDPYCGNREEIHLYD